MTDQLPFFRAPNPETCATDPDQIKQSIKRFAHSVRNASIGHFTDSFSTDPDIMPLVIEAIEKHGWDDAFDFRYSIQRLPQTEATVLWLVEQLEQQGQPPEDKDEFLTSWLLEVLNNAAPPLLQAQEQRILKLSELLDQNIDGYTDNPMVWMEPFLARLARELRLEQAVPLVLKRAQEDEVVPSGDAMWSLAQIGTDAAADALANLFENGDWELRYHAAERLGLLFFSVERVVDHGLLEALGSDRPTFALRPGARGNIAADGDFESSQFIAWHQDRSGSYNPSQIVCGDYLYTRYDQGFLTCHDARSGEEVYGRQRFSPSGSFTASPFAFNGRLLFLSEDGLTYVVRPGPEFEILQRNLLDKLCLSSPAIVGDKLLIRTATKLYCLTEGADLDAGE